MDQHGSATLDHPDAPAAGARRHAWEGHYPPQVKWRQPVETMTLPQLLERSAARYTDRPLIEYRDRQVSFTAIAGLVDRMAAGFLAAGYGPGSTIALFLPNTPWHTVCFFAALKAGARLAHLSPLDAPREVMHKISDSGAAVVVATNLGGLAAGAAKLVAMGVVPRLLIGEDAYWGGTTGDAVTYGAGVDDLAALLDAAPPAAWPEVKPSDLALLQYTGGTTGLPKGAMLTHANMLAATFSYLSWREPGEVEAGPQRVIGVLPMFHVYALGVVLLLNIADGNMIMLRPRFDLATTIEDIETKRATSFPAVPTMIIALLSAPGVEDRDFSSLTMLGSGGAPLPTDVAERAQRLIGHELRTGWGMTETAAIGTRVPTGVAASAGMIGVPLPNVELRIVGLDDPTRVLPPGEVGEMAIRGPNVTSGYWNQPELSAKSFADGFFLTGDIGHMSADGLFTLIDRKKRMIISGGFNVYPAMIEDSIYEHPDVEEVIVIGIPDEYRGEAAKAFIKQRAGTTPLDIDTLKAFLADKVGKHEMPKALELRDSLPKSPVGKLLATQLADEERARTAK